MCQERRRNSPSVAAWSPTSSWRRTASRMAVVLDRAQLGRVDPPRGEVVARGEQVRRAEQAADVVGAERRCRARRHQAGAWQTASTLFPSRSWTKAP